MRIIGNGNPTDSDPGHLPGRNPFLGRYIIGTGHHWYWTGQTNVTVAFSAMSSALEVVPLTLLTLDAWDFIKLSKSKYDICGREISIPHRWTFYFMMAVGFWNFVGAGIFGIFAISFLVFSVRQLLEDDE